MFSGLLGGPVLTVQYFQTSGSFTAEKPPAETQQMSRETSKYVLPGLGYLLVAISYIYMYQIRYVSMSIQDNSMHFSSIDLLPQAILTSGCSGSGWGGCTGQEEHALHLTILSFVCLG